jgi:hypothetical protein
MLRTLKTVAAVLGGLAALWYAAVRLTPDVKARKASWRSR